MIENIAPIPDGAELVTAYHDRTKHYLDRYAAGPDTLDWDMQPNPFREFAGAPRVDLPLGAGKLSTPLAAVYRPGDTKPQPASLQSVGVLLELAMGISAWKEYGPDRWALRCNPSSGNLHPTEVYLACLNIAELENALYHYVSRDHVLEQRCRFDAGLATGDSRIFIGLSSVHWREAWKYGERAFRYCQLDVGHALGALRYAAGALGWTLDLVESVDGATLARLLGLDRTADFGKAEPEEAELLLEINFRPQAGTPRVPACLPEWTHNGLWEGQANILDTHPMYRWPVIEEIAGATRKTAAAVENTEWADYPPLYASSEIPAAAIMLQRRSAQRFDATGSMPQEDFYLMLDRLLPRQVAPWDIWNFEPRLHPVLFVHHVEGMVPGLYALPRSHIAETRLRTALSKELLWEKAAQCPEHLPLFLLMQVDCRAASRTLSCRQAIAADGCFSMGMLAEFNKVIASDPWLYRQLYWEAGLIGHVLYLEAETTNLRGTGIGCFFDDAFHELLGIADKSFQSLYHFTVGLPLHDDRILTLAPYPGRDTGTITDGH